MIEPDFPRIVMPSGRSEEEYRELDNIIEMLVDLHSEVSAFRSSIVLTHYARNQISELGNRVMSGLVGDEEKHRYSASIFGRWPYIGAHYSIDTLYQVAEILSWMNKWAKKNRSIDRGLFDPSTIIESIDLFNEYFPKWEQTRHATAHRSEIRYKWDRNAHKAGISKGPIRKRKGTQLMMQDCFEGNTFVTMRCGEILRFDITPENYNRLLEVYNKALSGASGLFMK